MAAPRRIAIRADGGGPIGLGHVMRCGALARTLHERGASVDWLTGTPDVLPGDIASVVMVRPVGPGPETADTLIDQLKACRTDLLVGDWKETDANLVEGVRDGGWPVALIGGFTGAAVADLHVRQSFIPQPPRDGRRELSGAEWLLLGPQFRNLRRRQVIEPPRRIVVTLGGTATPVLDRVMDALADAPGLDHIVIEYRALLGARSAERIKPLSDSLAHADLGILAGGTTLHEAAALGLPAICLPIVPNQVDRASQFERLGLGLTLDPHADGFAPLLRGAVAELLASPDRRREIARRGQTLVDGRGADRLAEVLLAQFARGRAGTQ